MKGMESETLPYQPYVRTSYTVWVCPECGSWTDGAGYDADDPPPPCDIGPTPRVPVELVPKTLLVDATDIQTAAREGICDALKATKQELRNVRAGVWAALSFWNRGMDGMALTQLRGCLPQGYTPVAMGGDPDIAASTATKEGQS